jgi:hypothetical protein
MSLSRLHERSAEYDGAQFAPQKLANAYELLRGTKPFNRWRLPPAERIRIRIHRSKSERGEIERDGE